MSTKRSNDDAKEERPVGRYNLRSVIYRNISPDSSSSSDSNFDDSFEQLLKKKMISSANSSSRSVGYRTENSTSQSVAGESMVEFLTEENKIEAEDCDALDHMFKNIAIRDTSDDVPVEWLEKSDSSICSDKIQTIDNARLTTVYEDHESNYRSSKSIDSAMISKDSLDNATGRTHTSKDSLELSEINSETNTPIEPNDTLEDVEYVHDEQDRYLLKPVSKRSKIPSSPISPVGSSFDTSIILIDSSPDTSYATANNDLKLLHVDEIKSEISYKESPVSYKKAIPLSSVDSSRDTSIMSVVSNSNGSYATARDELKAIEVDDIKSEDSYATGLDLRISYPKTTSFFDLESDESRVTKSNDYYTALLSIHSNSTISSSASVSPARYNTLDDVSSLMSDNSTVSSINRLNVPQTDSTDSSKHFNDSLERMEYMMEQGRKIQEKTNAKALPSGSLPEKRIYGSPASSQREVPCSKILGSSTKTKMHATPESQRLPTNTKPQLFSSSAKKLTTALPVSQTITPASRILKPSNRLPVTKSQSERKYNSPTYSSAFKKPNYPTPVWKKESNTASAGRIPQSKNKHFGHIVSPIGAYIKNIAAPPLLANVKPTSEFFDSSYCNKIPKELDYSVMSDKGGRTPVASLPMKFFSSSHQQRIIDGKTQKIPGGDKLNRIIGQIPLVIHHEGRIHSGSPQRRIEPVDESVANMSVMSGDISVQIVRDVKRQ